MPNQDEIFLESRKNVFHIPGGCIKDDKVSVIPKTPSSRVLKLPGSMICDGDAGLPLECPQWLVQNPIQAQASTRIVD